MLINSSVERACERHVGAEGFDPGLDRERWAVFMKLILVDVSVCVCVCVCALLNISIY